MALSIRTTERETAKYITTATAASASTDCYLCHCKQLLRYRKRLD